MTTEGTDACPCSATPLPNVDVHVEPRWQETVKKSVPKTHRHRVSTGLRNNMQARCSQRIRTSTVLRLPVASTVVRVLTGSTATKNERDFAYANAPTGKRHRNRTRTQYFDLCPYAEACGIAASQGTQTCSVSLKLSHAGPRSQRTGGSNSVCLTVTRTWSRCYKIISIRLTHTIKK